MTSGIKFDVDKLDWSLLPFEQLDQVVRVLAYGAEKYDRDNWQRLIDPQRRYFAATLRHLVAWRRGELVDSESGLSHLAHAACNLLFLLWFEDNKCTPPAANVISTNPQGNKA